MEINWKQDYQGEFICPKCNEMPLKLGGLNNGKATISMLKLQRFSRFFN